MIGRLNIDRAYVITPYQYCFAAYIGTCWVPLGAPYERGSDEVERNHDPSFSVSGNHGGNLAILEGSNHRLTNFDR